MTLKIYAIITASYSTGTCFIVEPVSVVIACTVLAWLSVAASFLLPDAKDDENGKE